MKKPAKKQPKIRRQFDFSTEEVRILDETREALHATSDAEAVRRSVALMHCIAKAQKSGAVVSIEVPGQPPIQILIY